MAHEVHGTFISEKVNKIRWRPDTFNDSNVFVTGSWDNLDNFVTLWNLQENEHDSEISPVSISSFKINGDVTELSFVNPDLFLASSSDGKLSLFKITLNESETVYIEEKYGWDNLHHFSNEEQSSCTSFANYSEDVVTIGEDGRINLLTVQTGDVIKTIDNADSCTLNCVTFLKYNEILTGNIRGQMKIWDIRESSNKPSNSFMLSGDQVSATCLAQHPTQLHMIIAGDEEGSLTVWDLRQNTFPVNLLSGHSDVVTEIHFHPDDPELLCSSSMSGELWLWKPIQSKKHALLSLDGTEISPWYSSDMAKTKLEIFWLMPRVHKPINSLDLRRNRVLCGCDNEAVYLINDISIC